MEHPFEAGEVYENRNGVYEVVEIDENAGTLLIRYLESGEEVESSIAIQARIWRNMSWEAQAEARQRAVEEASYQKGYGEDFTGLVASDFKTNTAGTAWRSRRALTGRVALLLSRHGDYTFISWSIYRWPVAFMTRIEDYKSAAFKDGVLRAKFMIELDNENAYFGFYVERGNREYGMNQWDWNSLLPELQKRQALQDQIAVLEEEQRVRFLGRMSNGQETFHFADGLEKGSQSLWDEEKPWMVPVAERVQRLAAIPDENWGELYLIGTLDKEAALQQGVRVAHHMAEVMQEMLGIYGAAVAAGM